MRFGITSVTGLIAGLLAPFSAFMRTPTLMAIGGTLAVSFAVFIYLTLGAMKGAPQQATIATDFAAPSPTESYSSTLAPNARPERVDPTMQRMLSDIYGDLE